MCYHCAENNGAVEPLEKRPAAEALPRQPKLRIAKMKGKPAAEALSLCTHGCSMPIRTQSRQGVLGIVRGFRETLKRAMPTDARAYLALPRDMPLHSEMFALLLKETWLVKLYEECYAAPEVPPPKRRRKWVKMPSEYQIDVETEQTKMRSVVSKLLGLASIKMDAPTPRMRMERKILSEQRGLIWFGGIQTFKRLGLVGQQGQTKFSWGSSTHFLTEDYGVLDAFVKQFLQFELEHSRPTKNCDLEEVTTYSRKLGDHFAKVPKLGRGCKKYILPHAIRKIILRHEELTQEPSTAEFYGKFEALDAADDDRTTFWRSQTLADLNSLAPDSKSHLSSLPQDSTLFDIAKEFKMHPFMISCWACLIGKACDDYGIIATSKTLCDDNEATAGIFSNHVTQWGDMLPPSMSMLMAACGKKRVKKIKNPTV